MNTYRDFLKKVKETGMLDSFSKYDMDLARKDPDAGMSILNYKLDYKNAATDEEREAANKGAEALRYEAGNYFGGKDGSSYYAALRPERKETDYGEKELYEALKNSAAYGFGKEAPAYKDSYGDKLRGSLEKIESRPAFSYDPAEDELYSAYRKQYLREGQRSAEDTAGEIAALTGGKASSYAATAAAQAQNYYNAALTDKIPELYKIAYGRYKDEGERDMAIYKLYAEASEGELERYRTSLEAYLNERKQAQNEADGEFERLLSVLDRAESLKKQDRADYEAELERYYKDRDYAIDSERYKDSLEQQEFENSLERLKLEQSEDQRKIENSRKDKELEIELEADEYERLYDRAALAAKYGDYSLLEELGISADPSAVEGGASNKGDKNSAYESDPNYMYVSNYGYMRASVMHEYIRDGIVIPYYNTQTGKYYYIYAG